ncbi:serine protease [bacterium]|nr:serine protease [bacterium]
MKKVLSLSPRFSVAAIRSFAASLIGVVFFLGILPVFAHALTPGQVFDKVKDSVVVVKILDAKGKVKGQGSGVILPSGKVATNCHVVKEGASYQVGRGKQLVSAILYAEDRDKDICVLDAKGIEGIPAQFGKAANLKVGDIVYAVGAPQGLELSLSDGIVAQLRGSPSPLIQTTAAISPGSSGGGLFDKEGRLVGLTTFYVEGGQSLNFAMPVEWISEVKPGRKLVAEGYGQTEWLITAAVHEELKNWQDMLNWCRKWTKSEPKNTLAWFSLAAAYKGLNRYNDAIEAYRQALRIDPEYALAWNNLGVAYYKLKRYDDAIEAYRQSVRINPEYASAWTNLGTTYGSLKRYDEAIDANRQALRIKPEDADAWYGIGNAYGSLKRYDDAIEAYRQALRIDPEYASAWTNLGTTYGSLKRYDDAIEAYRQALRINPESDKTWYNLGNAYGSLKRYDDAIEAYRQALRIDPEYALAWNNLGVAYALSGNRTEALNAVRKLRRLDPAQADKLFNLVVPR